MDEIVVLMTTPSREEGEKIAYLLVESRLAACVNIVPGATSIFAWEGRISCEQETLMIVKTRRELFERLAETVKKHHSYSVPEMIALPIVCGSQAYLAWLYNNTS